MEKRVLAAMGMLVIGYSIKTFVEKFPKVTDFVYSFFMAHPVVMLVFIGGSVLGIAFAILYGLMKTFLKWQDPDSGKSESKR